jgi:hypothetical protein
MIRPGFLATIQTPLRAAALRSYATQQAAKTVTVTSSKSNESSALLGNLEASWKNLSAEDRYAVEEKLAEVTKKDWKEMTPVEQDAGELGFGIGTCVGEFQHRAGMELSMALVGQLLGAQPVLQDRGNARAERDGTMDGNDPAGWTFDVWTMSCIRGA